MVLVRSSLSPLNTDIEIGTLCASSFALRVDADVLEWFRSQGPGYQTHINAVLRACKEASLCASVANQRDEFAQGMLRQIALSVERRLARIEGVLLGYTDEEITTRCVALGLIKNEATHGSR